MRVGEILPQAHGHFPSLPSGLFNVAYGNGSRYDIWINRVANTRTLIGVLGAGCYEFNVPSVDPGYIREKLKQKNEADAAMLADFVNCQLGYRHYCAFGSRPAFWYGDYHHFQDPALKPYRIEEMVTDSSDERRHIFVIRFVECPPVETVVGKNAFLECSSMLEAQEFALSSYNAIAIEQWLP